jgi:alpha-2-macroglobulin-like protein
MFMYYSTLLSTDYRPSEVQFAVPSKAIEGTLAAQFEVYPTAVSSLTKALARLIQEPYGCFEQTASTMYPMAMALQVRV